MSKVTPEERAEAIATLREIFPVGSMVGTVLRHVSASGMSRDISVISPGLVDVSRLVSNATGVKLSPRGQGVRLGGCGMDMGFALVYELSRVLYADGFYCVGEHCPANDHTNDYNGWAHKWRETHGDDEPTTGEAFREHWANGKRFRYSPSRKHSDAGYALRQCWV